MKEVSSEDTVSVDMQSIHRTDSLSRRQEADEKDGYPKAVSGEKRGAYNIHCKMNGHVTQAVSLFYIKDFIFSAF